MRNTIDGLFYTAPVLPGIDGWSHMATFPALSFVLASKRDTKFVFHAGKDAVLVFESGEEREGQTYTCIMRRGRTRQSRVL